MTIALFLHGDRLREVFGVELLNRVSALLRDVIDDVPKDMPTPVGPDFAYGTSYALFHTRRGRGPLHVVWDTNLLIDYFEQRNALWSRGGWSERALTYEDELEALQLIIALWVIRDIRFHVLRRVFTDAKRRLDAAQLKDRMNAWEQFSAAMRLVAAEGLPGTNPCREGLCWLPHESLTRALGRVPAGADRALVRDAVELGAHVFLTRDRQVLRSAGQLRPFGLFVGSPGELLEELVACGAFHCLLAPEYAYWPLPDQGRVAHLLSALPRST